jgi:hypothetical protein
MAWADDLTNPQTVKHVPRILSAWNTWRRHREIWATSLAPSRLLNFRVRPQVVFIFPTVQHGSSPAGTMVRAELRIYYAKSHPSETLQHDSAARDQSRFGERVLARTGLLAVQWPPSLIPRKKKSFQVPSTASRVTKVAIAMRQWPRLRGGHPSDPSSLSSLR